MTGEICIKCGKRYKVSSSVLNEWYHCTKCGAIYCPDCGRALPNKENAISGERKCNAPFGSNPICGGSTELF